MTAYDVDLFVIGGGSGGVRAARVAAEHGARVAIAESNRWGGTCVIRGCVPKKLLVYASEISRTLDDARGNGWTIGRSQFDWAALVAAKDKEIARLSKAYVDRLRAAGCKIFDTRARLADAHTIEVGGTRVTAENILVATGSVPRRPAGEWITSDEAFHLDALPRRIAILGGGYIGVEFAHIFAGFGSEVTLVYRDGRLLRGFDPDLRDEVARGLAGHGIKLETGAPVASCRSGGAPPSGDAARSRMTSESANALEVTIGDRAHVVDLAMAAVGRMPATAELGLAEIGVRIDERGAVLVDEWSRSNLSHVYAVGDVTARVLLTPVAIREGHAVADTLFGKRPTPIRHHLIPTAVFAQPPAASIGLSEPAACDSGHDVVVFRTRFRPMRYALSGRDEHVMIKVIVDRKTDRVLGIHIVGPDAPEIIQSLAVAVTMGATKADLDRTFALHPTTAEELVLLR